MNLARLEYFVVLAKIGNLQRASELLHISPPALSKSMKLLEEEFEIPLWTRDGRRMVLTDEGKRLLKNLPQLLDSFQNLKHELRGAPRLQPIRIGTFEVFSTYFLSFLDYLHNHSLEMHELLPGEIENHVAQGDLDFGITYIPVPDPHLDFIRIAAIEMGVYTKQGAFKDVPQRDLPFVIPVVPFQGVPTRVRGLDGWPDDAYERIVKHRVTLLESALELCRQGRVAGYFPTFIAREHNKRFRDDLHLERIPSPYAGRVCRSDVFIVKRKSTEENTLIKKLSKAIRLVCTS